MWWDLLKNSSLDAYHSSDFTQWLSRGKKSTIIFITYPLNSYLPVGSWFDCCKKSDTLWVSISSQKLMAFFLHYFAILYCVAGHEGVISSRWSGEVADVIKWDSVVCQGQGLLVWTPARTQGGFRLPISNVQVPISILSPQLSGNEGRASP